MQVLSNAIARRLINGTMANLLGKIWVLLAQLVAIPVLTDRWGVEGYGVWLMLSTIPTYLALSDVGLGTAAGVEITKWLAIGDRERSLEAFQSVWAFLTLTVATVAFAVAAFGLTALWAADHSIGEPFGSTNVAVSIIAMTVYSLVAVQMSALHVVYRSTHKYALGTLLLDALAPLEGTAVIIIAWSGGGFAEAATGMLVLRLPAWLAYYAVLRRQESWFYLGWDKARIKTLTRLSKPSLAAFALTAANALMLQGTVLAVGWAAGAASVAVFGAVRFLSRIPLQFSGLVTRASIPELTRSQVAGDATLTRRLVLVNVTTTLAATVPFALFLAIFGPALLTALWGENLEVGRPLFALLALAAALNATWSAAASPFVAVNEHSRFTYVYLGLAVLAVLLTLGYARDALINVAAVMTLAEGTLLALVLTQAPTRPIEHE
jgi:O-antigen/teichoic acid export membrane protein